MRLTLDTDPAAFARSMETERARIARGLRQGVAATTVEIKETLRVQVRASGYRGSQALANAWRSAVYPKADNGTFRPAGVVFSAAPQIHASMDRGSAITAKGGRWLTIPTSVNRVTGGRGGQKLRVTAEQMMATASRAFVVPQKGKSGLLWCLPVGGEKRQRGGLALSAGGARIYTRATANERAAVLQRGFVVMFVLVRSVTPRKVLDVAGVRRTVPALLVKHIGAALAQGSN